MVPPVGVILDGSDFEYYDSPHLAENCRMYGKSNRCDIVKTTCTIASFEFWPVRKVPMFDGVFTMKLDSFTFVATTLKNFVVWNGSHAHVEDVYESGQFMLELPVGWQAYFGRVTVIGKNGDELLHHVNFWTRVRFSNFIDPWESASLRLRNDIFEKWRKGSGMTTVEEARITAEMGSEMLKTVTMVTKEVPVNENGSEYKNVFTWLYFTIDVFGGFIKDNKSMMLSRSETVDSFPTSKIPIRLFENDQEKVVMSHELLHAIEKLDVSGFEDKILAMQKLSAMNFCEVFEMIPSNIFKMF